jgi:hypothetical protein
MTSKKVRKENAKTRYDEKNPTVSFRVSIEERKRLDTLRKGGTSFREMILKGAGIIENVRVKQQQLRESEIQIIEEMAVDRALKHVDLSVCYRCGMPIYWDLTNPNHRRQISEAIEEKRYCHNRCPAKKVG